MSHISTFSGQSSGALTATVSFTVPPTATYAVVLCGMRGGDGAATTLTSVSMGAANFTLNSGTMRQFNSFQAAEVGYILAADLPSGSVTATATRGSATNGFTIAVSFFDNANQVAPLVALNGVNTSPADPFVTSISPTGSAVLTDIICTSAGVSLFTTNETGQIETSEVLVAGEGVLTNTSIRVVSSGANDMSWNTAANSNRTSHIIVAVADALASTTAALTGTVTASINENNIRAGGETIILTLTGDTFVAAGAAFDAQRQAIIDGLKGV